MEITIEEAIAIIENEKECINRASKNDYCNRDCYNCELVKTDTEILTAFDMAIKALEQDSSVLADMLMEKRIRGELDSDITYSKDVIPDVKCKLTVSIQDHRPCYCGAGLREVWRENKGE